jgi:hypothetical protein
MLITIEHLLTDIDLSFVLLSLAGKPALVGIELRPPSLLSDALLFRTCSETRERGATVLPRRRTRARVLHTPLLSDLRCMLLLLCCVPLSSRKSVSMESTPMYTHRADKVTTGVPLPPTPGRCALRPPPSLHAVCAGGLVWMCVDVPGMSSASVQAVRQADPSKAGRETSSVPRVQS